MNPAVPAWVGAILMRCLEREPSDRFASVRELQQALPELERAAALDPGNPRFVYVYAVALASAGKPADALGILEEAHGRHPGNREILFALTDYHRGTGNRDAALVFARKLVDLDPRDARARQILNQLEQQ